jgi:biopolymer transport protein ExbB/TolQ
VFIEQQLFQFALGGAAWVLWLLVGLSVLCFTIAFERLIYSLLNATPTGPFQAAVNAFFKGGDAAALERELSQMKGLEARVLAAGVEATLRNGPEAGEAVTAGTLLSERLKLERGLLVIGTVGSNSPFLGLFGTVLGIIKAFKDLSMDNAEGMSDPRGGALQLVPAPQQGAPGAPREPRGDHARPPPLRLRAAARRGLRWVRSSAAAAATTRASSTSTSPPSSTSCWWC